MHNVQNYGSVLQAYALQHSLEKIGCDSEIINYLFPPKKQTRITVKVIIQNVIVFLRAFLLGFPKKKTEVKFLKFRNECLKLSPSEYNVDNIKNNPPKYDIYMTGSDQVWNPRHVGVDTNFMLAFAPNDSVKVSYASSFATSVISEEYHDLYKKYLSMYNKISVREPSGINLVKILSGKEATVCCDPVFLLSRDEWDLIANRSKKLIKDKYILVYALYYMFDPYPELLSIINNVQKELGYQVIYLNGRKEDAFRKNSKVLKAVGPEDFINIIRNAEIVITSSFHGTAFSLIYNKPLMGIVRKDDNTDSRISSILSIVEANKSIIPYNTNCNMSKEELYSLRCNEQKLMDYRKKSLQYLSSIIH